MQLSKKTSPSSVPTAKILSLGKCSWGYSQYPQVQFYRMRNRENSYSTLEIGSFLNYIMSEEAHTAIIIFIIISIGNCDWKSKIHVYLLFRYSCNITADAVVALLFKQGNNRKAMIFFDNTPACQIAQILSKWIPNYKDVISSERTYNREERNKWQKLFE